MGTRLTRIGLLGGSFNPAHGGHRRISLAAMRQLRLDAVWWLVSPQNPLKDTAGMAPLAMRIAAARAQARHPRIRVTGAEARLGTRYTADTLAALVRAYPKTRFIWIMGSDNLAQFHRWHRWRTIGRAVPIAVVPRPAYVGASQHSPAMAWLRRGRHLTRTAAHWTEWPLPAIVMLKVQLDPRSASAFRALHPDWWREES